MNHFVYKIISPRETFALDMTEAEATIMGAHFEYWERLLETGRVVVYGPVGPGGAWGLAVVEAETDAEVQAIALEDPAVTSGLATFEIHPMLAAFVRP